MGQSFEPHQFSVTIRNEALDLKVNSHMNLTLPVIRSSCMKRSTLLIVAQVFKKTELSNTLLSCLRLKEHTRHGGNDHFGMDSKFG